VTLSISEKLNEVRERLRRSAAVSGRPVEAVTVVAVTKGASPECVAQAREAGLMIFGENKVQEAETKIPAAGAGEWHMIGHLQSNKVKTAVSLFSMIQSVDSVRLAKHVSEAAIEAGKVMPILLEVRISGESQKYGFDPAEVYGAADQIAAMPGVKISGVMGMAAESAPESEKRASFRTLKNVYGALKSMKKGSLDMKYLSMGMSGDFELAVEEGSNMVRLGRVLFS